MIGDEVTVTVLSVKGNQIRLGFAAPQNVTVHREEVYERIRAERLLATDAQQVISRNLSLATVDR